MSPIPSVHVGCDEMDKGAMSNNVGIGAMLLRWKCSVYKVVYREFLVFIVLFGIVSVVYRNGLDEDQKRAFHESQTFFDNYTKLISLPFLLGFYVTIVAGRWWQQYMTIPWPDKLMLTLQMYVPGKDERSRIIRRVLLRRALLMLTLLLRSISRAVRRRFPTLQDLVKNGIMTQTEKQCYESISPVVNLFWVPSTWFASTLNEAVRDGILADPAGNKLIMEEFLEFRANCGALWSYNWVSIPMVYTQVCTLATYSYFIACLMARQYTGPSSAVGAIDIYFPIGTVLELVFYVGLLKVAEQMKNPFGDDDEDFDLNFLLTRHLKTVHLGLDYLNDLVPPLKDDQPANNKDTRQQVRVPNTQITHPTRFKTVSSKI
ncbi:bestrophin-2 [Daphnia magna]|uniref:bestrophin-2 n=1 Tax=Daphnia magna TaxID=35525 RepID=UPI0006EA8FFD|nr:bestrophin-2 [Daphnia magna]